PIIAVYGVNDMAPWGHMYVNPGLTEPNKISICNSKGPFSLLDVTDRDIDLPPESLSQSVTVTRQKLGPDVTD
ncbi:hypothetical protein, partial [Collinsella aerofaciens]|uniref:hypothetical protein n=1 Tax=Collinsella aerofaciens TaxID=74426 RepID=UPI003D7C0962